MFEDDLRTGLAVLADHAPTDGDLAAVTAQGLRRRRSRRLVRTVPVAVLAIGAVVAVPVIWGGGEAQVVAVDMPADTDQDRGVTTVVTPAEPAGSDSSQPVLEVPPAEEAADGGGGDTEPAKTDTEPGEVEAETEPEQLQAPTTVTADQAGEETSMPESGTEQSVPDGEGLDLDRSRSVLRPATTTTTTTTVAETSLTVDESQPVTATLDITITNTDNGSTVGYAITCGAGEAELTGDGAAYGLSPEKMCERLAEANVQTRLVDGPVPRMACTNVYGGPLAASVVGTLNGAVIDASFSRASGCGGFQDWVGTMADILASPEW